MNWTDKIKITNEDNMTLMARYPDDYFDLAIVDPPYGKKPTRNTDGLGVCKKTFELGSDKWDIRPSKEYFEQLLRVSKNQIIWGVNYFFDYLQPTNSIVVWDKENGKTDFADCELAWTSFKSAVRKYKFKWHGMLQGDMKNKEQRIHPTQKPIALYKWLLKNYAKEGDKILDTHLGSGSIAIACHQMDFELTACELDAEYYNAAHKRFKEQTAQLRLAV